VHALADVGGLLLQVDQDLQVWRGEEEGRGVCEKWGAEVEREEGGEGRG